MLPSISSVMDIVREKVTVMNCIGEGKLCDNTSVEEPPRT